MRYTKPYHDAVAIQRVLKEAIDSPEIKPVELAQCARAWDVMEDRKRILKMKPKPRDADVSKLQPKPKPSASTFTDPTSTP